MPTSSTYPNTTQRVLQNAYHIDTMNFCGPVERYKITISFTDPDDDHDVPNPMWYEYETNIANASFLDKHNENKQNTKS